MLKRLIGIGIKKTKSLLKFLLKLQKKIEEKKDKDNNFILKPETIKTQPKSIISKKPKKTTRKKKKDKKDEDSDSKIKDIKKEFKKNLKFLKKKLSPEAIETIEKNPKKMKEIVNGLKNKFDLNGEVYDFELEKFTSKVKERNDILLTK
jgi:hypothetical protein